MRFDFLISLGKILLLRIIHFLLVLLLAGSCVEFNEKEKQENEKEKWVSEWYEKARDNEIPLEYRRNHINKALKLNIQNDSLESTLLYSKCNIHFSLKEYDSLFFFGHMLRKYASSSSDYLSLGKYEHLLAYYHENIVFNIDSAFYYNNLAKNYFLKIPDSSRALKRIIRQATLKNISNDFFGAKETLTEALEYLDTNEDDNELALIYAELAANNRKLLNLTDAISYYQLAIRTSKTKEDIISFKNNLATTFIDNKDFGTATSILKKLLNDSLLKKQSTGYARVLDNLSFAQWKKDKRNVEQKLLEALHIRKQQNDKRGQIASYTHLGDFFSDTHPKKAERYLDTVLEISKQLRIPKAEQDALKFLMDLQPNNTRIRNRYIFLQDSMYQLGLKVKTQFAKMKYDDGQKQLSILKLEAEKVRKNAELANQRTQKTLWLSLSGLLVLGGILAFYGLSQRHRKEKLQEVYETEKRISKKVHDELANDIYGVMTRMEHSKTLSKEDTLDAIEDIYIRTRDISHETGSVDTKNFQDELKKLLSQFRNDDTTIAVKGFSAIQWGSISEEKKITLYRILNELLVNMKKHSGATLVSIAFEKKKKVIAIEYSDNGRGVQLPFQKGAGLSNTENRIKNSNGTFSFESELGKGVRIKCAFPL